MKRFPGKSAALAAAAICFAAAVFFRFALIGYGVMALVCAGAGVCVLLYAFLARRFKIMLTVLLLLGLALFSVGEVPVLRAAGGTPVRDADYLIVLGAGVNGTVPSLSMLNRLTAAKAYLDAHPACVAVVSGGQGDGEDVSEAEAMFRWLKANGIDEARIVREDRATSTLENLKFSLALIPDAHRAQIAVCSSEYHLYRAQYLAQEMGYTVGAVPGRTSYPVLRLNYFIREGFGSLYYHIRKPT